MTADGNQPGRIQPETIRLKGIVPSITANDLARSVAWYRDTVGFHVQDAHEYEGRVVGYTLKAGDQMLLLNQDDGAKGLNRVKGQGIRLYLECSQDLDQVAAAIKARGGTLASEPEDQTWGARSFDLVDPDGFAFTIMKWL